MVRYCFAESGGLPVCWDGASHLLCVGSTGSCKTRGTMTALLYAIFVDNQSTDAMAVVLNPKRVGLDWIRPCKRVLYVNDPSLHETVYQGLADEMARRYNAVEAGEVRFCDLPPIYVFQDEMAAILGGGILPGSSTKPIKENLQKLLILAREARIFVCAFTQTCNGEFVGGTLSRSNFSSVVMMRVSNVNELTMAANIKEEDVAGTMNPVNFIPGECLASCEAGRSFVRARVLYHTDEELREAGGILAAHRPADFSFIESRLPAA